MGAAPWLDRRIINFAHQGGAHEWPSSTLYAIERAIAAGAGAIELDVHATSDRRLVVCHDETVDRTTDGSGDICAHTLAELVELDNAHFFIEGADVSPGRPAAEYLLRGRAPRDRRLGIATLDEVLASFPGVVLNLDIKRTAPEVEPYEDLLVEVLDAHGRHDDVIVASFNDIALRAFRALSPAVATSAATMETASFYRAVVAGEPLPALEVVAFQVPERFGEIELVTSSFVEAAHDAAIAVHVWTINDAPSMERLVALGVDGIITDRPTLLNEVLGRRSWQPGT